MRIGKIRVIAPIDPKKALKTPALSRTPRAIYATVRPDGIIKQISVYNKKREKLYDIDLDHDHSGGEQPEGHVQRYIDGVRGEKYYPSTEKQRKLVEQLENGLLEADYEFKPRRYNRSPKKKRRH